MYHDVVEGSPDIYSVTPEHFRAHLDAIARARAGPPATVAELRDGEWMITFDDGGASALLAGEELARRSWRGHFFIATDLIGRGLSDVGALAVACEKHRKDLGRLVPLTLVLPDHLDDADVVPHDLESYDE